MSSRSRENSANSNNTPVGNNGYGITTKKINPEQRHSPQKGSGSKALNTSKDQQSTPGSNAYATPNTNKTAGTRRHQSAKQESNNSSKKKGKGPSVSKTQTQPDSPDFVADRFSSVSRGNDKGGLYSQNEIGGDIHEIESIEENLEFETASNASGFHARDEKRSKTANC
mmetsp:Transcript_39042/g.34724  ORF Transcript_39042/g.34724 Transcript_39042/m.34724 type:complete len:169 (-) Transcript_39042:831-1337(-)